MYSTISYLFLLILLMLNVDAGGSSRRSGSSSRGSGSRGSGSRGSDSRGSGYRGSGSRDSSSRGSRTPSPVREFEDCCFGDDPQCDRVHDEETCEGLADRKGCQWKRGSRCMTSDPTMDPTADPTLEPTVPTFDPTADPTLEPTIDPTWNPTGPPTGDEVYSCTECCYDGYMGDGNYICNEGLTGYQISCLGHGSCRNPASNIFTDTDPPVLTAEAGIDCDAAMSCFGTSLVAVEDINCNGMTSCQSTDHSVIETQGTLYCGGSSSCQGTGNMTAKSIVCTGEGSCPVHGMKMIATEKILCHGWSVIRAPYLECSADRACYIALGQEVHCSGAASCNRGIISTFARDAVTLEKVIISGYQAANFAIINEAAYVEVTGTEGIVNAMITSNGIPEMMVIISGYNATFDSMCNCYAGTDCTILCNDDSCGGLTVNCDGNATCHFGVGLTASSFTEIDCVTNSGDYVVTDSGDRVLCPTVAGDALAENEFDISEILENAVNAQKDIVDEFELTADDAADGTCVTESECVGESFGDKMWANCYGYKTCSEALFTNVSGIQCQGMESCAFGEVTWSGYGGTSCNGKKSCQKMQYGNVGDLILWCRGMGSCQGWKKNGTWKGGASFEFNINSQGIECNGQWACRNAEMTKVKSCSGGSSCDNIVVDEASNIKCTGNGACHMGTFYNNTGDTKCWGNEACKKASLLQTESLYCDGRESCAEASIYGPDVLYARGERSLADSQIYSFAQDFIGSPDPKDITIFAFGKDAMDGTQLSCYGGSKCDVHCYGDACLSMKEYICYDDAICNCYGRGCSDALTPTCMFTCDEEKEEMYAFERVMVGLMDNSLVSSLIEMNESEMLLVGAGAVVMVLMAMFYFVRRSGKGEYMPLE